MGNWSELTNVRVSHLAISRTFLKKSEKVRLIKIMNEKAQTETLEHSNFLSLHFGKLSRGVRVKRSIFAEGTHQIGTTKRKSDLSGVRLKRSILA